MQYSALISDLSLSSVCNAVYSLYLRICKVEWVKISMDMSSAGHSGFSGCNLAYIFFGFSVCLFEYVVSWFSGLDYLEMKCKCTDLLTNFVPCFSGSKLETDAGFIMFVQTDWSFDVTEI